MGAWAVRFRVAALACCAGVVILAAAGLVAGLTYSFPVAPASRLDKGTAAFARAQALFSGTNLFSAVLLVVAVLLLVVAGTDEPRTAVGLRRLVVALGGVVALGAAAYAATDVWYLAVSTQTRVFSQLAPVLGSSVAAVVVAGAAAWWARTDESETQPE